MSYNILIVESKSSLLRLYQMILGEAGYQVYTARSAQELLKRIESRIVTKPSQLARCYKRQLQQMRSVATGATGCRLQEEVGLNVERTRDSLGSFEIPD